MYNVKKVNEDLYWIGASDRRLALFENIYPIPRGVSYNSYVILDEQTVLLDTVDKSVSGQFFRESGVYSGRQMPGLHGCKPHGARPLCYCGGSGKKISGSKGSRKCQDFYHDEAVLYL